MRFMGYTLYDALINWDLSSATKPSGLVPGLATTWGVDEGDASKTKWIFKLREGVKFHDGSDFTADSVVWNLDKIIKRDSPQFDARQSGQGLTRIPAVAGYRAIDKYTVEISTKVSDATLPYQIAWIMMSSPAQWEKLNKSWDAFARTPSGTGPWKLDKFVPRERAEIVPNKDYWDKRAYQSSTGWCCCRCRRRMRASPRSAPARSIGSRRRRRTRFPRSSRRASRSSPMRIRITGPGICRARRLAMERHRVRKAANLAVDRDGMKELLSGLMIPAQGFFPPGHQWFGNPTFKLKHDVAAAKN
jgi:ABC-type transport system substrate-binding protein